MQTNESPGMGNDDLIEEIRRLRTKLYQALTQFGDLRHPAVLILSKCLDEKIVLAQKVICKK